MKKQWVIIGLMTMSMGATLCAADVESSNQVVVGQEIIQAAASVESEASVSIIPVNYQDKVFTNGEYVDLSYEKYKVYSEANTVYVPLRLMTKVVSSNEEYWEAKWDSKKPDEVILQCTYMTSTGLGGWSSNGKLKTIKLTVGSCEAEVSTSGTSDIETAKHTQQLSKAPKKINGSICLPLRAIGEILGKQVNYKGGLIFISQNGVDLESEKAATEIKTVKTHLESKGDAIQSGDYVTAATNYNGVNYYAVSSYNEKTSNNVLTLYSQKGKNAPQVLRKVESKYNTNVQVVDYDFYYVVNSSRGLNLERFNLATMESHVAWQMAVDEEFNCVSQVIPTGEALYVVIHNGDGIMGDEELYKIVNGKCEKLITCSQFGSLIIEGDMIYYSEMSNGLNPQNMNCYNQKTKKNSTVGSQGYVYDMEVSLVNDEAYSYGICSNAFIRDGKLYTLAYKEGSSEKQAVCSIDLKTNEQKQITKPTANYWMNGDHIYYIESATGYIKTVDLEGNGEKTLVSTPVQKADLQNNCLYYTKQSGNEQLGNGLYVYGLDTGVTTTISDESIKDFKVSGKRIAYVTAGYAPGIYKWIGGKSTLLESRMLDSYTIGEGSVVYTLKYEKGNFVSSY